MRFNFVESAPEGGVRKRRSQELQHSGGKEIERSDIDMLTFWRLSVLAYVNTPLGVASLSSHQPGFLAAALAMSLEVI